MYFKKIACSILLMLFTFCGAFAETIVAASNTKFSVKIKEDFSTMMVGDYVKMPVNPRTLKNKNIDWQALNVTDSSQVLFTGIVSNVKSRQLESGTIVYYAQIDVNEFAVGDTSYNVKGKMYTANTLNGNDYVLENTLTKNYDVVLLRDFQSPDDFRGIYVDKTSHYAKIKAEKEKAATIASAKLKEPPPYPSKLSYPNWYYQSAKKCEFSLEPGSLISAQYTCLQNAIKNLDSSNYTHGYTSGVLPWAFAGLGKDLAKTEQEAGPLAGQVIQTFVLSLMYLTQEVNVAGLGSSKLTPEQSRKLKTGK